MTDALKSNQYVVTYKLRDSFNSLDRLEDIPVSYKKLIRVKKSMQDRVNVDNDDMYLRYSWIDNNNERLVVEGTRFTIWTARIEHQRMKMYNETGTDLLPKEDRTGHYDIPTIFFERNGQVFVAIVTTRENALTAVRSLINNNNIDLVNNYLQTDQNVIEWLFWRYMDENPVLDANIPIEIDNLLSFEGNDLEGNPADFLKGISNQISSLDVTKAILAFGDPLNASRMTLEWGQSVLVFSYAISGVVSIDTRNTSLDATILDNDLGIVAKSFAPLVLIIADVIPDLLNRYNNDNQNFNETFNDFKRRQAEFVINKLTHQYEIEE
ncbi:hypothetical protein FAM21834_02693 [Lentilactobacillus parabuchneri]|uniref:hypothetical protein n=1 Tax=Lentilactobacillus TaxID=2767893 RepID=UPI000A10185F|nr:MULTISPECIES: hypothetical protein [Lentilactobacillus]ORN05382.1 hypothetical protein FAM21834_02693 [Lentilactobacillus parabuchneri]TJY12147.1 hypothetical protein FCF15_04185 [Lentilactobacillus buchneri]